MSGGAPTAAHRLWLGVLLALGLGLLSGSAAAQFGLDPVRVELTGPEEPVPAGSRFDVRLAIGIDAPWHVYSDTPGGGGLVAPTATRVYAGDLPAGVRFVEAIYPAEAHELSTDYGGGLVETYQVWDGDFSVYARLEAARDLPAGELEIGLKFDYQACDDSSCLLPTTKDYKVSVTLGAPGPEAAGGPALVSGDGDGDGGGGGGGGGGAAQSGHGAGAVGGAGSGTSSTGAGQPYADGEEDIEVQLRNALAEGDLWSVIGLAIAAALLALLTPCVFPMIPITVSFFTKRAEAGHGAMSYALVYGLGIVATYTGFGLLLALASAGAAQNFATNPWVNFAVGALFVFFGLSLLGFYELKPPRFLSKAAESGMGGQVKGGYLPVFVMGFVFTITAFTCTAPVVGGLLAGLTTVDQPSLIVAGMLAFSTTFALPFVLLAIFPTALKSLPGAGGWMITIKVAMGFVELIASLKFFSNVDRVFGWELMPRPTMLLFTVMLLAAFALYLFGTYRMPGEPALARLGRRRLGSAVLVTLLCAYLTTGMTGKTLNGWVEAYLPPLHYGVPEDERSAELPWHEDLADAMAEARATGKNVFIDFTGITCVNCMKIERKVFDDPDFAPIADQVVLARLYTDRRDENREADQANLRLMQERFGTVTLPFYVLVSPDDETLATKSNPPVDQATIENFANFLRVSS